jgi:hypothetical protein
VLKRGETVARVKKREEGTRRLLKPGGGGAVPAVGVPRGAGAPWGLAPTGGRRLDRILADCDPRARARVARLCFGQGRAEAADGRAPVAVGVGGRGEARAVRGRV